MIRVDPAPDAQSVILTITNPPVNALGVDDAQSIAQAITRLQADSKIRSAVITGAGSDYFCAGADLNTFASSDMSAAWRAIRCFNASFEALQNADIVVIAAINGHAFGGGLECALSCDIRVADAHAQLALPEAGVGLLPGGGGTQLLPWLIGEGQAKRIILTGERVSAQSAWHIGLVEEVVDKGAALGRALELAASISRQSPDAVKACKTLIHQAREGVPRRAALTLERERFVALFEGENAREGVDAFLQKRKPSWS